MSGVLDEALERLASPGLWFVFTALFAAFVILVLILAQGDGSPAPRFDYDLF